MPDSPFFQAAKENQSLKLREIIQGGGDPNSRDDYGESALAWAANLGHTAIVKDLLAAGADVEAVGSLFSATSLILAARSGASGIVSLVSVHANVDAQDLQGASALMRAVERPDDRVKPQRKIIAIVKTLLESEANPNLQDIDGRTALIWAVYWRNFEAVEALIRAGADVSLRDRNGEDARMLADGRGNIEMVALLNAAGEGG